MKRSIGRVAVALLAGTIIAMAEPVVVITNFFPNYKLVASTTTNAGGTGLSTGVAYACFALEDLTALSESAAAASGTNSDIRPLMFAVVDEAWEVYDALASTNQTTTWLLDRDVSAIDSETLYIQHTMGTRRTITGTSAAEED